MLETTRTRALSAPAAVAAAVWLHEWLQGRVPTDDLLDELARTAPDTPWGSRDDGGPLSARSLLRRLRAADVAAAVPVLPRPGRTVGWPAGVVGDPCPAVLLLGGPDDADALPLRARQLLRASGEGWLLDDLAAGTVRPRQPGGTGASVADKDAALAIASEALSPRAATRRFGEVVDHAAADLGRLGLDRPASRPHVGRWTTALEDLPATADGLLVSVLQRAGVVIDAVDQALLDDGAAVTAREAGARGGHLHRLRAELCDLVAAAASGAAVASPGLRP